ncbi:MAG: aminoacyl-tRNA hydrolase [Actinomycetota bacterium]|nr:aminoacyl-tRNA hydrolase [Actinomycetota bacterium]
MLGLFGRPPLESDFLIVGLGNPGDPYLDTRHNVGHMVIDRLCALLKIEPAGGERIAVARTVLEGKRIALIKPATFMNTSGPRVKAALEKFNVLPANLIIIHDDLDLDFAKVRVKQGGGTGGHRGLNSVIASLGADEFSRIRIGIGRPPGRMDPSDFVLSPFSPKEWPEMEIALAEAADAAIAVVRDGASTAMNRYNKGRK